MSVERSMAGFDPHRRGVYPPLPRPWIGLRSPAAAGRMEDFGFRAQHRTSAQVQPPPNCRVVLHNVGDKKWALCMIANHQAPTSSL